MSFKFKTSADVSAAQYEGVNILSRTPKNPQDFHSIQDILRYRQIMMVDELYGNARIATNSIAPFGITSANKIKVSAVYYLDGYRMEVTDVTTPEAVNYQTDYDIYLSVKFTTIDFKTDNSIALQDSGTNKFIPTSERYRFTFGLHLFAKGATVSAADFPEADAYYLIGSATYSTFLSTYTLKDHESLSAVELTYTQAMKIAASSIHVDVDGWTYIDKVATRKTGVAAFIDGEADIVKIGIRDAITKKEFITIQTLDSGGLLPAIQLIGGSGQSVFTDDKISFTSSSGALSELRADGLNISTPRSQQFSVDDSRMSYSFPFTTGGGFSVSLLSQNTQTHSYALLATGDDATPSATYQSAKWILSRPASGQIASPSYSFSVTNSSYPQNGSFDINQQIRITRGYGSSGNVIAKIYFASSVSTETPDISSFQLIKTLSWGLSKDIAKTKLAFHPYPETTTYAAPVTTGIDISISSLMLNTYASSANFVAHFKIEYSLVASNDVSAIVEFLSSANISAKTYINPFLITGMDYMRLGNFFLWTDDGGRLRIKRMTNSNDGSIINALQYEPTMDSSVDSPGGIEVGGGVNLLNGLTGNISTYTKIDNNYAMPQMVTNTDTNEIVLSMPVINGSSEVEYGLMSKDTYNEIIRVQTINGSGLQSLGGHTDNIQGLLTQTSSAVNSDPVWGWDTATLSHVLKFADLTASVTPSVRGLVSKGNYDAFYRSAMGSSPANVLFVATQWKNPATGIAITPIAPYFTSIQSAINSATANINTTVYVHPGNYTGDITLKDGVDIIAISPNNTTIIGTVADYNLSNPGDQTVNTNGVKCTLNINIDTSITDNIVALSLSRGGTFVKSYGNLVSANNDDISHYTASVTGGRLIQYGDIGKQVSAGVYKGSGILVSQLTGTAMVQVDGDIFVSTQYKSDTAVGVHVTGTTANNSFARINGRIFGRDGVRNLVRVERYGSVEINNSLELLVTEVPVIYNAGNAIVRNSRIRKDTLIYGTHTIQCEGLPNQFAKISLDNVTIITRSEYSISSTTPNTVGAICYDVKTNKAHNLSTLEANFAGSVTVHSGFGSETPFNLELF